jgi:arylsulfatase A-like enzyme
MIAVVLSFDVFPLRLLGCYGSQAETVCLNEIAAASVVFDQHFGEDFSSLPQGHAWWTGCYHFPRKETGLLADVKSLPALLAESGVESLWVTEKTAGVVPLPAGAQVTAVSSFAELIHTASEVLGGWSKESEVPRLLWLKSGGLAWELAKLPDLLGEEEPSFLSDPDESLSMYRDLMTAAIERCDAELEPLWEAVREFAKIRPVLFLITAGRGLSLGERAASEESPATWAEEFVHLPLLVFHSRQPGGERRSQLTQSIDLPATLLDFLAVDPPKHFEGQSFLPVLRGEDLGGRESVTYGCYGTWEAIRTRNRHLVRLQKSVGSEEPRRLLFIKPGDVWDWHNVSAQELELTETLLQQLDAFLGLAKSQLPVPSPLNAGASGTLSGPRSGP